MEPKISMYPEVTLISYTQDPVKVVAAAAKLCYTTSSPNTVMNNLTSENASSFIERLSSYGHQSPFEHASFTFGITGMSRSCMAQLTRHRIASHSVQSQRYNSYEDGDWGRVVPYDITQLPSAMLIFERAMSQCAFNYTDLYEKMLHSYIVTSIHEDTDLFDADFIKSNSTFFEKNSCDISDAEFAYMDACIRNLPDTDKNKIRYKKIYGKASKKAGEVARCVLPNACQTNEIITMNASELAHFFNLRCCHRAQDEINRLAWDMRKLVINVAPELFIHTGPSCMINGKCSEGNMCCGNPYDSEGHCKLNKKLL